MLDDNKRLAWAAAVTFFALNGIPVTDVDVDAAAEDFMFTVAKGELTEVGQIEVRVRSLYSQS